MSMTKKEKKRRKMRVMRHQPSLTKKKRASQQKSNRIRIKDKNKKSKEASIINNQKYPKKRKRGAIVN